MKQKRYLASLLAAAVLASAVSLPALALDSEENAEVSGGQQVGADGAAGLETEVGTSGETTSEELGTEAAHEGETEPGDTAPGTVPGDTADAKPSEPDGSNTDGGEFTDDPKDTTGDDTVQEIQPETPADNSLTNELPQPAAASEILEEDSAITEWSQVPTEINNEVLDLSQLEGANEELRTIEVSGDCTVIGRGLASDLNVKLLGLQFVLKDNASLALDNVNISMYDSDLSGVSAIVLEAGARASLSVASDSIVQAYHKGGGAAIQIPQGSELTLAGGTLSIKKGNVSGDGTLIQKSGTLALDNVGISASVKDVQLCGGKIAGKGLDFGCVVGVKGGTVLFSGGAVEKVALQGDVVATDVELELPSRLTGNLTMHGGKFTVPGVDGDVTVDGGELIVEAGQFKNGINGDLTLSNGATARVSGGPMGTETDLQNFAVAVDGDVTIDPGCKLTAVAAGLKTVSGEISANTVRGSFAQPDKNQEKKLVLNGDKALTVTLPVGFSSFAVTVLDGGTTYTASDRLGLNAVATTTQPNAQAQLAANGDNANLCWYATGTGVQNFILDDGKITVSKTAGVISANYAGIDTPITDGELKVTQDDETTANQIVIGDGVTDLTLTLDRLNVAVGTSRQHAISIGKNAEVTIKLVGNSTIRTDFANGIRLADGAAVTITGDGSLNASNNGVDCAVIRVPQGAELTVDGTQLTVIGGGAGIGTDANFGTGDLAAGRVVLTGGAKIYAKGGNDGAGIGGGLYASGGELVIENAEVTAYGGGTAAAIGGGGNAGDNDKSGFALGAGSIQIGAAAKVTAQGGSGAAAIGRGRDAKAALAADAIVIEDGAQVRAVSSGFYYAVDTNGAGDAEHGARMLNVRFAEGELPYVQGGSYNIDVVTAKGVTVDTIDLPVIAGNEMGRAFALTLPAGEAADFIVQNGADGKHQERAQYALLADDAQFLYHVGKTGMTTRDELAFQTFTLTASKEGEGTITPAGESVLAPRGDASVTFAPAAGYHVASVTVDGAAVQNPGTSYPFTGVTEDHTILVKFEKNSGGSSGGDGGGDDDRPTKPTTPDVDVPDGEVPLGPAPGGNGGVPETEIPDGEIPLGDTPEIVIEEEGVPLADAPQKNKDAAPKTGDRSPIGLLAALLALSCAGLGKLRRKEG